MATRASKRKKVAANKVATANQHVDGYVLGKGDGELDRSDLGEFGGDISEGARAAGGCEKNAKHYLRPLLLWSQDESIFKTVQHHSCGSPRLDTR